MERFYVNSFIVKIASRCNLNCSYCYIYNKGNESWKNQPKFISDEVFRETIFKIKKHCFKNEQWYVSICFHGGEPTLIGHKKINEWSNFIRKTLSPDIEVEILIQTNGVLINKEWVDVFKNNNIQLGISLDGPKEYHDKYRVNHKGEGSFDSIKRAIDILYKNDYPFGVLCVLPISSDPISLHSFFCNLNPIQINYLFPDFTHNQRSFIENMYGETPLADFIIPIFDYWCINNSNDLEVPLFSDIIKLILGGEGFLDIFGNGALSYIFIETNGDFEGLDVLKICNNNSTFTGLNIRFNEFSDLLKLSTSHSDIILGNILPPFQCNGCSEFETCKGGYLPHRFSLENGFNNPSVWCKDIKKIFLHVRDKFGVDAYETMSRKKALKNITQP